VNGLVLPIKELADLAHNKGLLISVDGAQSFGVLPLDVQALGLDHYAAPGQKNGCLRARAPGLHGISGYTETRCPCRKQPFFFSGLFWGA